MERISKRHTIRFSDINRDVLHPLLIRDSNGVVIGVKTEITYDMRYRKLHKQYQSDLIGKKIIQLTKAEQIAACLSSLPKNQVALR